MGKKRSYIEDLLPAEFQWSSAYTYMEDLIQPTIPPRTVVPPNSHYGKIKKALYETSKANILKEIKSNFSSSSSVIDSALKLLNEAAHSERNKELNAVKAYKKKLDSQFPERWKDNKKFAEVYNNLMGYIQSGTIDENAEEFYLQLITAINLIRQDELNYLQRLEQIIDDNRNRHETTYRDLASNQYLYRAYSDIETMFKESIGIATKKNEDSFSSRLQKYVYTYITKHRLPQNTNISGDELMAIMAAVLVDLERFVQNEYYAEVQKNAAYTLIDDPFGEILDRAWNKYLEVEKRESTLVQKAVNGDAQEFKRITSGFKSLLGIKQLSAGQLVSRQQKIRELLANDNKRYDKKGVTSARNAIFKNFLKSKSQVTKNRAEELQVFTWNIRTKNDTRHGTLQEMAALLIGNAFTTHGISAGEDTYTMGEAEGKTDNKRIRSILDKHADGINYALKNYYKKTIGTTRRKRLQLYNEYYKEMNDDLKKEVDMIKKDLEKTGTNPENIFIYHESLKLYSRIEQGRVNEFEGRELQILSAFDRLYSIADIDDLVLLQKDILIGIAANLSDFAVGASAKGPLEKYLSIFAGLLMFDDIRNVAIEAINGIKINSPNEIHLYLLNNIYVPSSMILTNIYNAIKNFGATAENNSAKVTINVKEANNIISNYVANRNAGAPYDKEEWDSIADGVINGTKIQITFLAGFVQLLQKLSTI